MRLAACSVLVLALAALGACVTINVYFPEAAAEKAAEQFVGKVIGPAVQKAVEPKPAEPPKPAPGKSPSAMLLDFLIPSAHAQSADITIQTPQIRAIQERMKERFEASLAAHFDSGAVGFTRDGLVAVRDAAGVPLADRAALTAAVADDNRDRKAVYREVAVANGHPEWESQIQATFAKQWADQARTGWYVQDGAGAWKRK